MKDKEDGNVFTIGFIDYFLDEWHANNYPRWIEDYSKGEMKVTHAFGLIDSPRGGMTTDQWCEKFGITKCDTIDEVLEKCDGIIVLSPDNAEMHLQLCQKPLRCGKPVYVDKTFAPDEEIAKQIFAIAEESGTPCYSSSALRYAEEYQGLDTDKIHAISSWGPNGVEIYSIHQIEPIIMLMKTRAKRVMCVPSQKWSTFNVEFVDGRAATLTMFEEGVPFTLGVCMDGGNKVLTSMTDNFKPFIYAMLQFFRDKKIPVPHEQTLDVMALRGACIKAEKTPYVWVDA